MGISYLRWLCVAFLFIPSLVFAQVVDTHVPNSYVKLSNGSLMSYSEGQRLLNSYSFDGASSTRPVQVRTPTNLITSGTLTQNFSKTNLVAAANAAMRIGQVNPQVRAAVLALSTVEAALNASGFNVFDDMVTTSGVSLPLEEESDTKPSYPSFRASYFSLDTMGLVYSSYMSNPSRICDWILNNNPSQFDQYREIEMTWYDLELLNQAGSYDQYLQHCAFDAYTKWDFDNNGELIEGREKRERTAAVSVNRFSGICPDGYSLVDLVCMSEPSDEIEVPIEDIEQAIDDNYVPFYTDLDTLEPYAREYESIDLSPLPSISESPTITTTVDNSTGTTIVTETTPSYDFEIKNNNTKQPSVEVTENINTKVYENGQLKSDTTTTNKQPVYNNVPDSGGSTPPDLPAFCTWASIVCDWLGWTQEPIDEEPDLSNILIDQDFEQDYSISFGSKTCPAPIDVYISLLDKDIEISFEWFCELAELLYFMVMAAAYIFAAYISLGVVRNG